MWEYLGMPDAETNRSLLWWPHQECCRPWEWCSGSLILIVVEIDALKSTLVPKPLTRIGRVAAERSFAHRRRLARLLYQRIAKNTRQAIRIPTATPTDTPMITKSALWTISWFFCSLRQEEHLAEYSTLDHCQWRKKTSGELTKYLLAFKSGLQNAFNYFFTHDVPVLH